MKFELVLPCYNEADSLRQIAERSIAAAREYDFLPETFKLILVENGSSDHSKDVCRQLMADSQLAPWIKIVYLDKNLGYGNGLHQGLMATSAEVVGWSHADQQCDPKDAFRAWKILADSSERQVLVKGVRFGRNWKDKFISRVFEKLASVYLNVELFEVNAQPKVFHRSLLALGSNPPSDFSFDLYFIYQAISNGFKLYPVAVEFSPRVHGVSNWANGLKNRSKHIIRMIRYMQELAKAEGKL